MSNVIATDVQTQEIDSALVELFEVTLPNGTTLYFHPGLDSDLTDVQFRDKTAPTAPVLAGNFIVGYSYTIKTTGPSGSNTHYPSIGAANNNVGTVFTATGVGTGLGLATQNTHTSRDYNPMPMMIDGLSLQADGASSRPAFTVANIGSLFQTELGDFKNDDLIGQRLVRRQTLQKYLVGGLEDASPPIEFPSQEYVIDRIAEENPIAITYEVATPFDLENIQIPRRIVVGKYCSWKYQGHASGKGGGCTWNTDGAVNYNGDGTVRAHKVYFDFDDRPLVASETFAPYSASTAYTTVSYVTHGGKFWVCTIAGTGNTPSITSAYWKEVRKWTEWASGTTYQIGTLVRYDGVTIWKATGESTGQVPTDTSPYWLREEICGKTLQSCKARYGFKPSVLTSANQKPEGATNLAARLPFGSFPGTLKY
jgi:lambda family phage minor tail protein L